MRSLRFALLAAIPILAASTASAQQPSQLPRVAPTTGLADSSLFICTDSTKANTRACKFNDVQKRLAFKLWDSLAASSARIPGTLNLTGGSITGAPTATLGASTIGAITGTTANFSGAVTVASCTGCGGGGATVTDTVRAVTFDSVKATKLWAGDGTAAAPSISFLNSRGLGFRRRGVDTLGLSFNGVDSTWLSYNDISNAASGGLHFSTKASRNFVFNSGGSHALTIRTSGLYFPSAGNAGAPLTQVNNAQTTGIYYLVDGVGTSDTLAISTNAAVSAKFINGAIIGNGSMVLRAGQGNSNTITMQSTTSAGTAKNTMVLGADSSVTVLGRVRLADSLVLAASGAVIRNNANGDMTIRSGNGASSSLTLKVTNSGGSEFSAFNVSASSAGPQLKTFTLGSATFPIYSSVDGNDGLYFAGNSGDTTAISNAGASQIRFIGNKWIGGDASTTIQSGVGASRTLTLATTTSGSAVKNSLVLGADSSATFLGKVIPGDTLRTARPIRATGLTAASGTPNSVCIDATTKEFLENSATSCVVSSRRFKDNISTLSLSEAKRITSALRPVTFDYKAGKRKAIGLIAEEADSVDSRLASRDNTGRVTSVNYEQVAVMLLAVVKDQQRQLDSLKAALRKKP